MTRTNLANLTPEEKRALLARLLTEKENRGGIQSFPLSFAQERLWFIDRLQPGVTVYSIPAAVRLRGSLDAARLDACLDAIIARHESLRTRFVTRDGAPTQVVDPPFPLDIVKENLPAGMIAVEARLQALVEEPFDLERGPLIRCRLFSVGVDDHVLALVVHHIVADYWSLQVLIRELTQLYAGKGEPHATQLPPLPIQYPDYAVWQKKRNSELLEQLDYWRTQMADAPQLLQLPADYPRPAIQSFDGARHAFQLDARLSESIVQLSRSRGQTPFMVLLAAFQLLLHRYSGADDICVGSTISNRDRAELRDLIGLFVNNLVFRTRIAQDDTFDSLLKRVGATALDAYAHQEVPFEQVVDTLNVERSLSHNALFQVMFVLHNTEKQSPSLSGLEVSTIAFNSRAARFDISLDMYEGENFTGVFEYNADLFHQSTIAQFASHFSTLLKALVQSPTLPLGSIDLLDSNEHGVLAARNRTAITVPNSDVATLFEACAARREDAEALICGDDRLTYRELNIAANQLAERIRNLLPGQPAQQRIAVCLPRSSEMVVAFLAILKLGAIYIPLDPGHPVDRLRNVLEDGKASLLLVRDGPTTLPQLLEDATWKILDLSESSTTSGNVLAGIDNPVRHSSPDDLAYIIFTSGSTGRPKGVPIRQDSLVNLLTSMAREPGMTEEDTFVAVTTPAFDIATLELFMPLLTGGRLVVAEAHTVYDDLELSKLLAKSNATMMQATPATWRLLLDGGWQAPRGFRMFCGGEALDPLLAKRLLAGEGELWNLYGPTETTIWSACTRVSRIDADNAVISIGHPIANTQLHVLDQHLMPVPDGVVGQLYIGGMGLSPGYLDRDDLTAAAFVANPFYTGNAATHSPRLYRTGDAVRRLRDGNLVYLGRLDFQVKLRGFRIELTEIEAVLNADSGVEQAVVALHQSNNDDGELVAYCRLAPDQLPDTESRLRSALSVKLPAYMIPAVFMFLEAFPLNANGKVDRKKLPKPEGRETIENYVSPKTSTEALVADLWGEILGHSRISRDGQFFDLGGHSLLAARMIARLRPVFDITLPLRALFEKPHLRDFAKALDDAGAVVRPHTGMRPTIPLLPRNGPLPLSFAQQRQWTLAQLEPDSPFYNMPGAVRLKGKPDLARLSRAFEYLCDRQEVLRSRFFSSDGRAMIDLAPYAKVDIVMHEVGPDKLEAALIEEARRPFDLAQSSPFRISLFVSGGDEYVLLLVLHHIVADALSGNILIRDLAEIYRDIGNGREPTLPPLPVQYADFAAWQRSQDTSAQLAYWTDALKDTPPLLELPTDFARPAQQGFDGDSIRFKLDAATSASLKSIASNTGATPFMVMLAMFAHLLGRYSGMEDVVVGSPVSQRPHADLEGIVGMFVNTLALRLHCKSDDSFEQLLDKARTVTLDAFANQDVPFEQVVDALSLPRNWSYNPLFQAMLVWQTEERREFVHNEDLDWHAVSLPGTTAKVDLSVLIHDGEDGISGKFEYRTDLFKRETIVAMSEAFVTLIQAAIADQKRPMDQLSMLHSGQRRRIRAWNSTSRKYPDTPVGLHQLVEATVHSKPDSVAVVDCEQSLTYRELDLRANALAARLASMGIGKGCRVGISLPRRVDLIAAILAVLKTGAAYVPLDPRYPEEHVAFITSDADLALLLTDSRNSKSVETLDPRIVWEESSMTDVSWGAVPEVELESSDLAYIIYTSGSTGRPKGVSLEHRNAVSFIHWSLDEFSKEQLSGVLASTSICFDLSIFEIFATLSAGGKILLVDDLFSVADASFADEVTLINTVPTPIAELLKLGPLPSGATTICLAGEPLPPTLAAKIYATGTVKELYNLYGPSEDTTYSTFTLVQPSGAPFGIGSPIANTQAHVLDKYLQEVPIGMPGELYLSGAGIARGYWNRPDLTAERFVPNPHGDMFDGPILYQTGDRARWLHDGTLAYLGRADRQVKLHGFRIEPGEIETVIMRYPGISGVAVDIWKDAAGHARLAAWVETTDALATETIAGYLRERLPEHFVPALFKSMIQLPRLPNGKLDRKALPDPSGSVEQSEIAVAPEGTIESRLAHIWSGLLGIATIGRHDNFFSLGGDSIMAIQAVAQARQVGIALSPRDLFQHPTLADLAFAAKDRGLVSGTNIAVTGVVPLGPIQSWFLERDLPQAAHWNQGVVLKPSRPLDSGLLQTTLGILAQDHDVLRARFNKTASGWQQVWPAEAKPLFQHITVDGSAAEDRIASAVEALHSSFDLANGPVWGAILIDAGDQQRLAIAAHHLVIDGVSWRILLADLQAHYLSLEAGSERSAPIRSSSVGQWVSHLSQTDFFDGEAPYWASICEANPAALPLDNPSGINLALHSATVEKSLDEGMTRKLLQDVPASYPVKTDAVLLAALFLTIREWTGENALRIDLESHGRPDIFDDIDLSRTVGWLTGLHPVLLKSDATDDAGATLLSVKETLSQIPYDGIGYGVLRHLRKNTALPTIEGPVQIRFNYLGQMDNIFPQASLFLPSGDKAGRLHGDENPRDAVLEINMLSGGGRLHTQWIYGAELHRHETIDRLSERFLTHLTTLIGHCLEAQDNGYTPSDFPHMDFDQGELDELLRSL